MKFDNEIKEDKQYYIEFYIYKNDTLIAKLVIGDIKKEYYEDNEYELYSVTYTVLLSDVPNYKPGEICTINIGQWDNNFIKIQEL